jgi:hypothetical protein
MHAHTHQHTHTHRREEAAIKAGGGKDTIALKAEAAKEAATLRDEEANCACAPRVWSILLPDASDGVLHSCLRTLETGRHAVKSMPLVAIYVCVGERRGVWGREPVAGRQWVRVLGGGARVPLSVHYPAQGPLSRNATNLASGSAKPTRLQGLYKALLIWTKESLFKS